MKRIYLTAAVIATCIAAQAQMGSGVSYLKAADKYYEKGDYFSAASYYEKYLGINGKGKEIKFDPYTIRSLSSAANTTAGSGDKQLAAYKLADSYRKLNYYVKAEPVYEQVITFDKSRYPLSQYYYAITLRSLSKYVEAEKSFQAFLDGYGQNDQYTESAKKELLNLRFIQEQLKRNDLSQYTITKVEVSADGANYAPVWKNASTVLFTSTRKDAGDDKRLNKVYQAQFGGNVLSEVSAVSVPAEKNIHQGVLALSPDGTHLFLTRWTIENGNRTAAIYSSTFINDKWSTPVRLDDAINMPGYSTQQPLVLPDGRHLVFSSNRPGGHGGYDLWIAELDASGKVSQPQNMGSVINTSDDEQAPAYHIGTGTLVFASNGRVGMGGFDLFKSKGSAGNWKDPQNLGHPINSAKDDIYFASKGGEKNMLESVLISSDRSSDCCLDLFHLTRKMPDRTVEGRVVGCEGSKPLPGAVVTIVEKGTGNAVTTVTTDATGKYSFTLPEFKPLQAVAKLDGYKETSLAINEPAESEDLMLYSEAICLESVPPPVNVAIVIPNIYYEFNKTELTPESYPSLDSLALLMDKYPGMTVEIGAHTDNIGTMRHNQVVSDKRAQNIVAYLQSKGIDKSRLVAKGYSYTVPVAPNKNANGSDNPAGREKNRRTEMKVLHY